MRAIPGTTLDHGDDIIYCCCYDHVQVPVIEGNRKEQPHTAREVLPTLTSEANNRSQA